MDRLKKYVDEFQIVDYSPSNDKEPVIVDSEFNGRRIDTEDTYDDSSDDSRSKKKKKKDKEEDGKGLFSGMKSFFKISKKEEKERKHFSTSSKKLPKNFANQVLDYELKIDSGQLDIENVDKLM